MSSNECEKRDDTDKPEVHSANSWETADLGDKSRNNKFLRLMGASKKEHHGRFVIGDQDGKHREKTDEKHMAEELEDQYKHSLEHSMIGGKKGHIGLGFHGDDNKPKEEGDVDDKPKDKTQDVDSKGESGDAKPKEKGGDAKPKEKGGDAKPKEKGDGDVKKQAESDVKESGDRKRESESLDNAEPEHEDVKKMKFVKSTS